MRWFEVIGIVGLILFALRIVFGGGPLDFPGIL